MPDSTSKSSTPISEKRYSAIKSRAFSALQWQALNTFGRQILTFLTGIFLARLLAPEDFGLISMATIAITWISILGDAGVGVSLIQRNDLFDDDIATAFCISVVISGLSAALIVVMSPLVANFYSAGHITSILYVYALSVLLGGANVVPGSLLRRKLNFKSVSKVEITGTLVSGLVSISLALRGIGPICVAIGSVVGLIASLVVYFFMGLLRIGAFPSLISVRRFGNFTIFASGTRIVELIRVFIDNAIIGKWLGPVALGYYVIGYNLPAIPEYRVVGLITSVAFPTMSTFGADRLMISHVYLKILRYASAAVLPMLIGLMLVADKLIPVIYGPKWFPTVPIMQILCLAGIGCSFGVLTDSPLLAMGKSRWTFLANLVWVGLLAGGLIWVLVLGYGLSGAAWVVTGSALIISVVRNVSTSWLCGVSLHEFYHAIFPATVATTVMAILVLVLKNIIAVRSADWIVLFSMVSVGSIAYIGTLIYLWPELRTNILSALYRLSDKESGKATR